MAKSGSCLWSGQALHLAPRQRACLAGSGGAFASDLHLHLPKDRSMGASPKQNFDGDAVGLQNCLGRWWLDSICGCYVLI